jgi:predicted phage terminase large subunit-like protein
MNETLNLSYRERLEISASASCEMLNRVARRELLYFTIITKPDYSTQWFHKLLCSRLDDLANGKIKKLMVFMPPQHGKSELVSRRFPAYLLGKNPKLKIAACSYSADLAAKFNREVQRIIDDPIYSELFPETKLNNKNVVTDRHGSWLRNSDEFEIVNYGGSYKSVGVMGPLTGNPVDFGIIDDPIKDRLEAQSETFRNRLWEWYLDVFCTRLHNNSRILLTMTRWNEDDLAGRILQKERGWEVLKLPAIREDMDNEYDTRKIGEPLWPDRHSKKKIEDLRALSERTFVSMYQQRPAPADGGLFKRSWWKTWVQLPHRIDRLIMVWDCSFKDLQTSDYVVGGIFAKSGTDSYMLDMVRGHWDFPETVKQIKALSKRYPHCQEKFIEDKANGTAVIQTLKNEIVGIVPINPTESKESRAYSVSFIVESGHVFLPAQSQWTDIALAELSVFPNGVNDDIVDVVVHALRKLYSQTQTTGMNLKI